MADRLDCAVMPYAWGSHRAIAELQGRPWPTREPEAELWMGAHPLAPSRLLRGNSALTLLDAIATDPTGELGTAVVDRFGPRLPFLLKILAADRPLSLQAHPPAAIAQAGFADEERRGVPLTAPARNYKDPHHKPELICALTPFDALSGFRRAADTLALFDALAVPALDPLLAPLRSSPDSAGLGACVRGLMALDRARAASLVDAVVAACRAPRVPFTRECALAVRLAGEYPGDIGIVTALMLNLIRLDRGDALYLDAGNLHAYVSGVGVEIMASSDNVLRGGLTAKHVDVPELLKVLSFADDPVPVRRARALDRQEGVWDTPAPEFRLSRFSVAGGAIARDVSGPEILLCVEGQVTLTSPIGGAAVALPSGAAAFVPARDRQYALDGEGVVFRASVAAAE